MIIYFAFFNPPILGGLNFGVKHWRRFPNDILVPYQTRNQICDFIINSSESRRDWKSKVTNLYRIGQVYQVVISIVGHFPRFFNLEIGTILSVDEKYMTERRIISKGSRSIVWKNDYCPSCLKQSIPK